MYTLVYMASQSNLICAVNLFKREHAEAIHSGDDLKEERKELMFLAE